MAQTILYYPTIDIRDGSWLRNAILYWDEVSSIVPYEDYRDFSPELSYLKEVGVYIPVYPQELFSSAYAQDFSNSIVNRITAYDHAITKKQSRARNAQVRIHKNKIYAPALHRLIHSGKMPENLLLLFKEKRFINDYNCGGWMEIDSEIAHIYMRTLAEYSIKCSDKDIVLGTNSFEQNHDIYASVHSHPSLQTQCCQINIEHCLPQPSMDVSYEDILHFKAQRKDELWAFREKLSELETNIYRSQSPEEIKHHEARFVESWQHYSDDFCKVLKDARITYTLSTFASLVAIPFVGQYLTECFGQRISSAIQNITPFLQLGVGYFDYKNKISPAKSDGGFSYIIQAHKNGIIHT